MTYRLLLPESHRADLKGCRIFFLHGTGDDPAHKQLATCAPEILAVALRPLTTFELGWAMALNESYTEIRTVEQLKSYLDERQASSLLQPVLLQTNLEDAMKRRVRAIHNPWKT